MNKVLKVLIIFAAFGCSNNNSLPTTNSVVAKGTRVLATDTNDAAADFTFVQSYSAAQAIGVSAGTLHLQWSTDEGAGSGTTSGSFTDTNGSLASINAFYPATSPASRVSLTLAPVDTGAAKLPSDLNGLLMSNATVITRFNKFVDWVLTQTPNVSFTSIQIGNEIDTLPSANTAAYWSQYQTFLTAVVSHIHSVKPGIKVGVTVTLYGLIGLASPGATAQAGITALAGVGDELGLTYYPLDSSFNMKSPSTAASEMAQVFTTLPSTQIYFQEVGYATSGTCNGSEANQSAFVDQVFSMWDAHIGQVPFLSFVRMNDLSLSYATTQAGALSGSPSFVAYLQTLGFRTYPSPSSYKSAWVELQTQTHLRGWW
jgi:hypothetical protein